MAEDCPLQRFYEGLLTRKPLLNFRIQDISNLWLHERHKYNRLFLSVGLLYSVLTRQVEAYIQNSGLTVTLL